MIIDDISIDMEPNNQICLVIRHSIREEISDARNSSNLRLTNEGRKLSVSFGRALPLGREIALYHSHIERCEETAKLILEGFNKVGGVGQVQGPEIMLGCPYIKNENDALGMVNELGGHGFFSEWAKGNIDSTIMENYQASVHEFTSFVNNKLESGPMDSLRVFVTHDFNILLMLGLIHDLTDEQYQWPGYLDGGLFIKKEDGLWLKMRGKQKLCLDWKISGGEK